MTIRNNGLRKYDTTTEATDYPRVSPKVADAYRVLDDHYTDYHGVFQPDVAVDAIRLYIDNDRGLLDRAHGNSGRSYNGIVWETFLEIIHELLEWDDETEHVTRLSSEQLKNWFKHNGMDYKDAMKPVVDAIEALYGKRGESKQTATKKSEGLPFGKRFTDAAGHKIELSDWRIKEDDLGYFCGYDKGGKPIFDQDISKAVVFPFDQENYPNDEVSKEMDRLWKMGYTNTRKLQKATHVESKKSEGATGIGDTMYASKLKSLVRKLGSFGFKVSDTVEVKDENANDKSAEYNLSAEKDGKSYKINVDIYEGKHTTITLRDGATNAYISHLGEGRSFASAVSAIDADSVTSESKKSEADATFKVGDFVSYEAGKDGKDPYDAYVYCEVISINDDGTLFLCPYGTDADTKGIGDNANPAYCEKLDHYAGMVDANTYYTDGKYKAYKGGWEILITEKELDPSVYEFIGSMDDLSEVIDFDDYYGGENFVYDEDLRDDLGATEVDTDGVDFADMSGNVAKASDSPEESKKSESKHGLIMAVTDNGTRKASVAKESEIASVEKEYRAASNKFAEILPVVYFDDYKSANTAAQNWIRRGVKPKSESKKSERLTLKQKDLKDLVRLGEAEDITSISDAEAKELKEKGIETIGISRGIYGMNGALLRDYDGKKYAILARNGNLFYFV